MTEAAAERARARARLRLMWTYFGRDVRRRRGKISAGIGFSLLLAVARVAEPWPLKIVFDQVLFHRPATGAATRLFVVFGNTPTNILAAAAVALIGVGVIQGMSYYQQDFLLASSAQEIVYAIRTRLYRHLQLLPMSFHMSRPVGDTLVRLSSDIVVLRDVLIDFIVTVAAGIVMIALMITVMLLIDPVLTALAAATMPLAFVITYVYGDQIRARSRKQRRREGEVAALMHESLSAMSVVQLHGAEARELARFAAANKMSLRQGTKTVRLEAKMNRAVQIALAFGGVVVLWVGTFRAIHGHISPGDLIVFTSYLRAAYRPLRRGSKAIQRSAKALAAAERIVEVLAIRPSVRDAPDAVPAPPFTGALRFEAVSFEYVDGEEVLHGIDLELPAGRRVAVIGPSGSGKSTLVRLLPRLYDPTGGRVTIDGRDLRGVTLESLRSQISVVEQESVLMSMSLRENVRYGRPDATDEEVDAAIAAAGLDAFVATRPDGLETVVAERGASISGGERQRVAIARALIRQTPILLLDEPTTGLDPVTKREVMRALLHLVEGRTALIVTHDLELARQADEIVLLVDGAIRAQGTWEELEHGSEDFQLLARSIMERTA
ncbi:MAG: ABC transporter ATP-binding protein [Solirubrobacteraceae bacterium]